VLEGCFGLLSRVANGRTVAVEYGPAAAAPVRISEEDVERLLVNLVRNAAAAMGGDEGGAAARNGYAAIRITLGLLASRVGEAGPWPFQRVRLSVEDAGCGMDARQVEWLLRGGKSVAGTNHGIGFQVVRELVASSGGELQVMSEPGAGTRVQIEWPIAAVAALDMGTIPENGGRQNSGLPLCGEHSRRREDAVPQTEMGGAC
jgi:signal transduction histidine kinase